MMAALWIGNYEFFVRSIADRAANRNLTVDPRHSVSIGYQAIHVEYTVDLILPLSILINRHLCHGSVGFYHEATRVAHVAERHFTVLNQAHQKSRTIF